MLSSVLKKLLAGDIDAVLDANYSREAVFKMLKKEKINLGYIGLGRRGMRVLRLCFSEMKDVQIGAVCDINKEKQKQAQEMLVQKGLPKPDVYDDYHELLKDPKIDAVVIMTGWNDRITCAIDAMNAGKYTGIEVGCAYNLEECYALIDAYEKTGVPLMMLENCCYGRREMMALRMVREGLFGEVVFCEGGYRHYLNDCELLKEKEDGTVDGDHYRLTEYRYRNCEQYPTHELGPISKILQINRGNRMMSLSSFASKGRGLETYIKDHLPQDSLYQNWRFRQGDIVTTVITCAGGEQIRLTLDTTLPRAFYSRGFTIRGTKGLCEESAGDVGTFFLEGMPEGKDTFGNEEAFYEKYDHPLHAEYAKMEVKGDHDGMDWLVMRAFVESVKNGTQTPIDAYDTVTWLAIAPLSERSIALGGAPVEIPDFTKGKWLRREAAVEGKYSLDVVCEDARTPIIP